MTTQLRFGTIVQAVDNPAILSEEQLAQIVARVLAALRADAMRVREAKLAELRAHCALYGLPGIPTNAERQIDGSKQRGGRGEFQPPHHNRSGQDE